MGFEPIIDLVLKIWYYAVSILDKVSGMLALCKLRNVGVGNEPEFIEES